MIFIWIPRREQGGAMVDHGGLCLSGLLAQPLERIRLVRRPRVFMSSCRRRLQLARDVSDQALLQRSTVEDF